MRWVDVGKPALAHHPAAAARPFTPNVVHMNHLSVCGACEYRLGIWRVCVFGRRASSDDELDN